ncbi:MAG: hypothetical protein ACI8TP_004995 [Acidimicrobiales bacterium]
MARATAALLIGWRHPSRDRPHFHPSRQSPAHPVAGWDDRLGLVGGGLAGVIGRCEMLRGMVVRPTGTVTFLFTDIEGSTQLWGNDRASMEVALARHDEILHGVFAAYDGFVFAARLQR